MFELLKSIKHYFLYKKQHDLLINFLKAQDEIIYYYQKGFNLKIIHQFLLDTKKINCSFDKFYELCNTKLDITLMRLEPNQPKHNKQLPKKKEVVIRYKLD